MESSNTQKEDKDLNFYGVNWSTPTERCGTCVHRIALTECEALLGSIVEWGRCLKFRKRDVPLEYDE